MMELEARLADASPGRAAPCVRSGGPACDGAASAEDARRFRHAVDQHYAELGRFVRRMGLSHRADDVAQSAFLVALEALPRIVPGSERAFLHATAARIAYRMRRRALREVTEADLDGDSSPDPSPDDLAHQKRVRETLDAALEGIENEPRAVFVRFEIDGLSIPEIAIALAIPRAVAIRRLRRARRQFRDLVRVQMDVA